jgi:hypothetical protein
VAPEHSHTAHDPSAKAMREHSTSCGRAMEHRQGAMGNDPPPVSSTTLCTTGKIALSLAILLPLNELKHTRQYYYKRCTCSCSNSGSASSSMQASQNCSGERAEDLYA